MAYTIAKPCRFSNRNLYFLRIFIPMRIILTILLLPLAIYLLVINAKLYYHPKFLSVEKGSINYDIKAQLYHLKTEIQQGAVGEMQDFFPEGFVFMNVMYGLALCNYLANSGGHHSPDYKEIKQDLIDVSKALHSSEGTRIFNEELLLPYGAYYKGWVTYFEGKRLSVDDPANLDSMQVQQFQANCEQIAHAYRISETPWVESYRLNTWPADNVLCIAALKLHDQLFPSKYDTLVTHWVEQIKPLVDPATGLIPHSVNMEGKTLEGARGSSQTLMLCFLPSIDIVFAKQQFALFQKHFVDDPFRLVGIREYPFGKDGEGDVDAGPVIGGLGGAASIVGIAAFRQNGEPIQSRRLRNEVEDLSLPISIQGKKFYFFDAMPMADAFLAWVNSFQNQPDEALKEDSSWWRFHICSLLVLIGLYLMWWRLSIKR